MFFPHFTLPQSKQMLSLYAWLYSGILMTQWKAYALENPYWKEKNLTVTENEFLIDFVKNIWRGP